MISPSGRGSSGLAYVSEVALQPIDYRSIDAGSATDPAYDPSLGEAYLGSDTFASGSGDPVSTYRAAFGDTVAYQFDNLDLSSHYQIDLTLFDSATSTKQERVDAGGTTICPAVPVNVV